MSVKKTIETTSSKILNSDIYDITAFVDDIKKKNIDGVDNSKDTLMVGMYGYLGYQFASLLQNAIVTASELSNEAIPTRAKFDRNVITHALSLGVKKVAATAANMKVIIMFPEKALRHNMIDGKFIFRADTPLRFDEFEFHTDYDIEINYIKLNDVNNGSDRDYVYTAKYIMDYRNPISDIDNPFLPPVPIFNYLEDNMVGIVTNIHQVHYREIHERILTNDVVANKTINFTFEDQMSHFMVEVTEPSVSDTGEHKKVILTPVYDGLYNQEIAERKYCYYQYINPNTIRIRFDPSHYQPPANSDVDIKLYTTSGNAGNFEYSEEKTIRLTSDQYTNLYCIIAQRGDDGSAGGLDRQTIKELQHIIPKEALSRGCITTLTDLRNFFNSLNNENSVLHVFRKEDNILDRVYYVYNLMKDSEKNIVPTNTIPIYLESTRRDDVNGKIYLESGTPIFYYKYGGSTDDREMNKLVPKLIRENFIGYLEQKIVNKITSYSFYNDNDDDDDLTTYNGTPTDHAMQIWSENFPTAFDPNLEIIPYLVPGEQFYITGKEKPATSYDFYKNASIYFKPYWSEAIDQYLYPHQKDLDDGTKLYNDNRWFFGTCSRCNLTEIPLTLHMLYTYMVEKLTDNSAICNFEFEFTETRGSLTIVTHYPMRDSDTIDPTDTNYGYIHETRIGKDVHLTDIYIPEDKLQFLSAVKFFRTRNAATNKKGDGCNFDAVLIRDNDNKVTTAKFYFWTVNVVFYDETGELHGSHYSGNTASRSFLVPDYLWNLRPFDEENKKAVAEEIINTDMFRRMLDMNNTLILDTINTIDVYSYDGQGDYSFNDLTLTEGDLIRFYRFNSDIANNNDDTKYIYTDPTTWRLGEVLSIEKNDGRIVSIEVLEKNEESGEFVTNRYKIPVPGVDDKGETGTNSLNSDCIVMICKISKFLYTTPLSVILEDDPTINSHRITASYYLDIINETRYQEFECINSRSPIQFILSSIKTYRSSYLSNNRYKYTIKINIKPNTGTVDANMVNRTQVIGVFYKKGTDETAEPRPIMYSIAKHKMLTKSYVDEEGNEVIEDVVADTDGIHYEITLYTRPFTTSDKTDSTDDNYRVDIIDDENNVYMGSKKFIEDIKAGYNNPDTTDKAACAQEFFDNYNMYTANSNFVRPTEMSTDDPFFPIDPDTIDIDTLAKEQFYVNTIYMNLNTMLKIYILYKYDDTNTPRYTDGLTREYLAVNILNRDALYNSVSQKTMFVPPLAGKDPTEPDYMKPYSLREMVLTNVYNTHKGINLLYDYSNVMNSYVTAMKTLDIFNPAPQRSDVIESYIVNRVPCVRYFYWNTEERVLTFLKDMNAKINYVLDAIAPLECTFGLDYKFFNTYGPSNMYHLTDDDGDILPEKIDNVALTMTFRAKFYNEDSDAASMIDPIKNTIKDYLEKLDQLDDVHFPNITTLVETEYAEYLIYFEFVSFNIYDARNQHIITNEDMEMLAMVPEFLHVDTNDWNGKPYINIRIVT